LKRVANEARIASFLAKNANLLESNSLVSLLTQNGRISKPKTSSLVGTLLENSRLEMSRKKQNPWNKRYPMDETEFHGNDESVGADQRIS
jgi:hypothetical protein